MIDKLRNAKIDQNGSFDLCNRFLTTHHQIGDEGVRYICGMDTFAIRKLIIDGNNISPIGIKVLSLAKWSRLEELMLGGNKFGNLGCKYLSRASFDSLRWIYLCNNQIGSAGILHLSKAQWRVISQIQLTQNPLSVDGTNQLARAAWGILSYLQISYCELTFPDVVHLLLQHAQTMTYFDCSMNLTEPEEQNKIKLLMQQKRQQCEIWS